MYLNVCLASTNTVYPQQTLYPKQFLIIYNIFRQPSDDKFPKHQLLPHPRCLHRNLKCIVSNYLVIILFFKMMIKHHDLFYQGNLNIFQELLHLELAFQSKLSQHHRNLCLFSACTKWCRFVPSFILMLISLSFSKFFQRNILIVSSDTHFIILSSVSFITFSFAVK